MSFWTDLNLIRPGRPPRVTAGELVAFARAIGASGIVRDARLRTVKVKFGRRVDRDRLRPEDEADVTTSIGGAIFTQIGEYDWDVSATDPARAEDAAVALAGSERLVYRAYLGFQFAALRADITSALATPRPGEPGVSNVLFADVSVEVSPQRVYGMAADGPVHVGWISAGMGGQGYLHPDDGPGLIAKVRGLPALWPMVEACRRAFPVGPEPADGMRRWLRRRQFERGRRAAGQYLDPAADYPPTDWVWGIAESG